MMWVAFLIVVGQGAIISLLLYFIRTFGQYTDVLKAVHDENMILRRVLARQTPRPPIDVHEGEPEHEVREVA